MSTCIRNAMTSDEKTIVYTFSDKIYIGNCDAIAVKCANYFLDGKIETIVFDLENVRLCDSYGLKFLIASQRKALAANKRLLLHRPDAILKEMLATTNLLHYFNVPDI